jgi:hypothetical protein
MLLVGERLESLKDTDYSFVPVLIGQVRKKNTTVPMLGTSGAVPPSHAFKVTGLFCTVFTVICIKNVEHSCQKWERIVPGRWEKKHVRVTVIGGVIRE